MINILFAALNLFIFYINQNGNIYVRGLNLAACLVSSLCAIIDTIRERR